MDSGCRPPAVHEDVIRSWTAVPFSSTPTTLTQASILGIGRSSSPVSTAAKTMDENLNSLMVKDQCYCPVDNVHNRGIDGGRR